jgi:hypothetical protein
MYEIASVRMRERVCSPCATLDDLTDVHLGLDMVQADGGEEREKMVLFQMSIETGKEVVPWINPCLSG